jgi:hypothetical protein
MGKFEMVFFVNIIFRGDKEEIAQICKKKKSLEQPCGLDELDDDQTLASRNK